MACVTTTLVVAAIGFIGGIGGVIVTQMLANHREDIRWRREHDRQQLDRDREDAARSYEHRREAYVKFIAEYHRVWDIAASACSVGDDAAIPEDFLLDLYYRRISVEIFGTKDSANHAHDAYEILFAYVFDGKPFDESNVLKELVDSVRRDLLVPDDRRGSS